MSSKDNKGGHGQQADARETIAGFLTSALRMEDQISRGVYEDYMSRGNWPRQIDDATFHDIEMRLTTLIQDTKRHREMILALVERYGTDTQPG
jgi:hypothetical protein